MLDFYVRYFLNIDINIIQLIMQQKETFGSVVRWARLQKKIGLREFATMMDLSPAYISQMEADICKPPREDKIQRIAEKLEIDHERLLMLTGKIPDDIRENILRTFLNTPQTVALFRKTKNIKHLIEEDD